jgi:hypothetical protein
MKTLKLGTKMQTIHLGMTSAQFNAALEALGLDHSTAATVLSIGRRSIIRYASGEAEVPGVVAKLITLLQKRGVPKEFRA